MQAQVTIGTGNRVSLGGFLAVSRTRLKELPGEKLAELAATDELELLYLHLQSMRNFDGLKDRLEHALEGDARTPAAPEQATTASAGSDEAADASAPASASVH
jgi:hypothetical protein